MKSIGSLLHSVALHTRVLVSKRMASSGELTPEKIKALRQTMEARAKDLDAHKKTSRSSSHLNEELGAPDSDFSLTEEALKEQVAVEDFVKKVFDSVEKNKK